MFIQHSIGRITPKDRRELLSTALKGIAKDGSSSPAVFNIVFRMLPDVKIPPRGSKEDASFREEVGLADPKDAELVADWFGKLLLLKFQPDPSGRSGGLTADEVKFLTLDKPETWSPGSPGSLSLPETRIRVASFLASGAFTDKERFMPAIYAAGHTDNRVSTIGEELMKRSTVSLEDEELVRRLFQAHSRLPPPYRIRILNMLSKSAASTTFGDQIVAVVLRDMGGGSGDAGATEEQQGSAAKGLELTKLCRALFEYINWVARIGPSKGEFRIGQTLIDHLRQYITNQGWPVPTASGDDNTALRSRAYETIGMLAKGTDMSASDRLSLSGWLFRSLSEDPTPEVVVNIDGALAGLTSLFAPPLSPALMNHLKTLFMTYMTVDDEQPPAVRSARHAATKWANKCLPFSFPMARWIDILAVAGRRDERSDVVEEGQKGLDPWTYYGGDAKALELPDWQALAHTFFEAPIILVTSQEWQVGSQQQDMNVDGFSVFVNFDGDKMRAFPLAANYCKRMLFLAALPEYTVEPGWERQLETLVESDKKTRETIRAYLKTTKGSGLSTLLRASFEGMLLENATITEQCARCFVEIASLAPRAALAELAPRVSLLMGLVKSNKKEIRALGAKAVGILGAHPSNSSEDVEKLKTGLVSLTEGWKKAVGSELNAAEGGFLALGHLFSRLVYYSPQTAEAHISGADALLLMPKDLEEAPASLQAAIFDSATQLWTAGLSSLPLSSPEQGKLVREYIEVLSTHAKKSNERAITALGRLTIAVDGEVADGSSPAEGFTALVLEKLYSLYEIKRVEVHFAIGEAITAVIARWDSDAVQLSIDVESDATSYRVGYRPSLISEVLQKLLTDCKDTKPSLLKASGIWLFCIIQYCSHLPEIQAKLRESQVAFMRLLSARDELVQETASRGLALVYEKGDPALKDALVKDLVSSFTGSGPQLKVDDDTELFDAGALPTGEGKSITSYKDIVNLANEVGDQSLVYKFMSLATNAAAWTTRSAFGRFGLSNILSESEIDPKLYPKLYRYRFDPNQNVQRSMNDIWKAIVKDPGTVLETHFDAIMEDLLKSILGKEWRVREASCAAISDLIQGRPFPKYERYYEEIWTKALKVLDDVKGSVRAAALSLCIGLSNTLVRQLEAGGSTANATAMIKEAVPFLMSDKGIESSVKDVQVMATVTVMKIAKHGGKALRPYIAAMVPHLLGLLSTIEHQAFNYTYLRANAEDRQKIDQLRSSMVSQSPISEAIEDCLRSVDGAVLAALAPELEATIKNAIGMPTKIGCSRVLTTLATRHTTDFAPHAGRFLQVMQKQALDKNDEVSQAYARAAAYTMRVAPAEAKERFAAHLVDLYFAADGEVRRQKVADAALALSKISPDHFAALEACLLPFVYVARHDADDYVRTAAAEVWDKHAGSSLSVARWADEILALAARGLDAPQWALKHAGARTAAAVVAATTAAAELGSGQVHLGTLRAAWPVYERALALKTFPDKEELLDVLPGFVAKGKPLWESDEKLAAQLRKIAVREAKRNNEAYRVHAFRCLWRFAAAMEDLDMLGDIGDIVVPFMEELRDEDRMDVDRKGPAAAAGEEDLVAKTASAALEAVARGYPRAEMKRAGAVVLKRIMEVLKPFLASQPFDGIRRGVWYKCVTDQMGDAGGGGGGGDQAGADAGSLALEYFGTLDVDKTDVGTEEQRSNRAKALLALVRAVKKGVFGPAAGLGEVLARMREVTEKALGGERSLDVQKLLKEDLAAMV